MSLKFLKLSLFVIFISSFQGTKPVCRSNILFFFPGANFSQKNSVWPLVAALADKGHNVTFLSPQVKSPTVHQNVTDLTPKTLLDMVGSLYKIDRFASREAGRQRDFDFVGASIDICEKVVGNRHSDPTLIKLYSNDTTFDLVIVNSFLSECGFFVAKYFNAKSIHYSPTTVVPFTIEAFGISPEAAWIPDFEYKFENIPMSFLDRAYNTLLPLYYYWLRVYQISPALQETAKSLLNTDPVPTLNELERNASLAFINSHMSADFARTLPPFFVDVGGMSGWKEKKEIPQHFLDFINGPNNGTDGDSNEDVVLITFGSTVLLNDVTKRHQAMFFQLIDSFPNVKFLMRWKGSMPSFLESTPKNLMISEWLPQSAILSHPNVKAFITHGGISSIHEATNHGVPMIVLPLFSDQDYNAYRIEAQEVGLRVEIRGMTGKILVDALKRILTETKFRNNMKRKSAIFRDRPQSPVEKAVFWTEFVLRHNNTIDTFGAGSMHLRWFQARLLDVYLFYIVIIVLALLLAFAIITWIITQILFIALRDTDVDFKVNKKIN